MGLVPEAACDAGDVDGSRHDSMFPSAVSDLARWQRKENRESFLRQTAKSMRGSDKVLRGPLALVSGQRIQHHAGQAIDEHCHPEGQLSVLLKGTMRIRVEAGWWLAPPGWGVWLPPLSLHAATYSEASELVLLKVPASLLSGALPETQTLAISDLLRELALEVVHLDAANGSDYASAISDLIVRKLTRFDPAPMLFLPAGRDARLLRAMERLRANPGLSISLATLALESGSSERTLARLFLTETGMTFARWRDHLRIVTALDLLERGRAIAQIAIQLGYQGQSSFTTMFTRVMGIPPRRYMRRLSSGDMR